MRIVFIAHESKMYGSNLSLISLANELANYDFEIYLIVPSNSDEFKKAIQNPKVHLLEVNYKWSIVNVKKTLHFFLTLKVFGSKLLGYLRVVSLVKKLKPDVIYTNNSVVNHGIICAKIINAQHVWHFRESVHRHNEVYNNLRFDFGIKIQKWLYSISDIRISNSEDLRRDFIENYKVKSDVVHNGVCSLYSMQQEPLALDINKEITFSIIGVISPNKGQEIAVKAFEVFLNRFPNSKLLLAGDGNPDSLLKHLSDLPNSEKIVFLGYVKDMNKLFEKVDVHLICSRYESFGRTAIEAMSNGIPVISTKVGGLSEIIEHGVNGLFFDGSVDDLNKKMLEITNRDLYAQLSKNSLNTAKKFSIEKKTEDIYIRLKTL